MSSALTRQQMFDAAWDWFVVKADQPGHGPSIAKDGTCQYRGPHGERCAVGVLIPDELYKDTMEGMGAGGHLLFDFPELSDVLGGFDEPLTRQFLGELQSCHDSAVPSRLRRSDATFAEAVEERLRILATTYQLVVPSSSARGVRGSV